MNLESLVRTMVSNPLQIGMIPQDDPTHKIDDVTSITWYRNGQYQVQVFAVPPNYIIPAHTHPNVDSYEVIMGGRGAFAIHGRWVVEDDYEILKKNQPPLNGLRGSVLRVRPNAWHGAAVGRTGAVFMSVQHWINGVKPHCVASDYTGPTLGKHHMSQVKVGHPVDKGGQKNLTFKDAAWLEDDAPWDYLEGK